MLFEYFRAFNAVYIPMLKSRLAGLLSAEQCAKGHPSFAVICASNALDDMSQILRSSLLQMNNSDHLASKASVDQLNRVLSDLIVLLEHTSCLSGFDDSRKVLLRHRIMEILVNLLGIIEPFYRRALDQLYLTSLNVDFTDDSEVKSISSLTVRDISLLESTLQTALMRLSDVIQSVVDPRRTWYNHFLNWSKSDMLKSSSDGSYFDPMDENDNDVEFWSLHVNVGGMHPKRRMEIFAELVKMIERLLLHLHHENDGLTEKSPKLPKYRLHESFIILVGTLIWRNIGNNGLKDSNEIKMKNSTDNQDDISLIDSLAISDVLTALIGWPPFCEFDDGDIFLLPNSRWQDELYVQWLAWKCIQILETKYVRNGRQFSVKDVFLENLADFLLWHVWVSSLNYAELVDSLAKAWYHQNVWPILHVYVPEHVSDKGSKSVLLEEFDRLSAEGKVFISTLVIVVADRLEFDSDDASIDINRTSKQAILDSIGSIFLNIFRKTSINERSASEDMRSVLTRQWIREGKLGTFFQTLFVIYLCLISDLCIQEGKHSMFNSWMRTNRVWNVLFSDWFFFWQPSTTFNDEYQIDQLEKARIVQRLILYLIRSLMKSFNADDSSLKECCGRLFAAISIERSRNNVKAIQDLGETLLDLTNQYPQLVNEELSNLNFFTEVAHICELAQPIDGSFLLNLIIMFY